MDVVPGFSRDILQLLLLLVMTVVVEVVVAGVTEMTRGLLLLFGCWFCCCCCCCEAGKLRGEVLLSEIDVADKSKGCFCCC